MDPTGAGTCAQMACSIDGNDMKDRRPPFTAPVHSSDPVPGPDCGLQASEDDFRQEKAEEQLHRTKEHRGWRKMIRNFTPS